jgi:hypothetical protein
MTTPYDYASRLADASEYQQTGKITQALKDAGIENVYEEQTGGFCMVVYIYNKNKTQSLRVVSWGAVFCSNTQECDGDCDTDLTSEIYGVEESERMTDAELAQLVEIVKANLWRLEEHTYTITAQFTSDRALTSEQIDQLINQLALQVEEPQNCIQEDENYRTSAINFEIEPTQEQFICGMCGSVGSATDGKVSQDSPDHKSFICKNCGVK